MTLNKNECNSGEGDIIGSYNGLEHFHEKVNLELNIERFLVR